MYTLPATAGWNYFLAGKHLVKAYRDLRKLLPRVVPAVRAFIASIRPRHVAILLLAVSFFFNVGASLHYLSSTAKSVPAPPHSECAKPEPDTVQVADKKPPPPPTDPDELLHIVGRE